MAFDWLNHKQLMIIKGIQKTPGDTFSAETGLIIFNLMSEGAVTLQEWSPNIPAVKSGGIWTDSPINDGRQLLAAPVGNVIEKMTITISDKAYLEVMRKVASLNQMAFDCRDYWQSLYQIEPVWLAWWAGCGVGLQYALLYNIEIAPTYQASDKPTIQVSITLEREPYWRGIPPGANPKIWTYYVNTARPQFNSSVASLVTGSDHLINQTINNKSEWTPAVYGLQASYIKQNFIDIRADQVPGDAPALVELSITADVDILTSVYIAKTSKELEGIGHDGVARKQALVLAAGDGVTIAPAVKTIGINTTGVLSNGSGVNFTFMDRSAAGIDGSFLPLCQWGSNIGTGLIRPDRQLMRGNYVVFCRMIAPTGGAAITDLVTRVFIEEYEDATNQYLASVTLPEVNPNLSQIVLHYMGTVTLPLVDRAVQSPLGYGKQLEESLSNLRITLQMRNTVAAVRDIRVVDLIFLPIDEGLAQVEFGTPSTASPGIFVFDNTGYLTRGEIKQAARGYVTNANSGGISEEIRGQNIMLSPHKNQRLYFISEGFFGGVRPSRLNQTFSLRLNIVPRWSGIRDT